MVSMSRSRKRKYLKMAKEGMHEANLIIIDKEYNCDYGYTVEEQLLTFLREELHNCLNCGGLLPELEIHFEGRTYHLTCYEILDGKNNKVAQTDYQQLELYCHHMNTKK
jgi:hypothetical protein